MGQTALGSTQLGQNAPLLNAQQNQFLSSVLGGVQGQAGQAYNNFLNPMSTGDYEGLFQQYYVNPAQKALQQQVIPSIQQSFVDQGAGSSSALNQALAAAASDVSSSLGQNFGNFLSQTRGQDRNQMLQALGQLGSLGTARTFEPTTETGEGWLGPSLELLAKFIPLFM